jgi:hypothetical protein
MTHQLRQQRCCNQQAARDKTQNTLLPNESNAEEVAHTTIMYKLPFMQALFAGRTYCILSG